MEMIEKIADAALAQESLRLRSLTQQFLRSNPNFRSLSKPTISNPIKFALAAGIVELLAQQSKQQPPSWTKRAVPLEQPIFLLKSASSMTHLRQLCIDESPLPLRKRGFYAPPNYLSFA